MLVKSFVENLNRVQIWRHFLSLKLCQNQKDFINCVLQLWKYVFNLTFSSSECYKPHVHVLSMKLEPRGC